ncbi:TIGR03745 family integrating conjugative element membrane protein [Salmonella enterica]|nr:TIGR03745 family integrating conjugative element membrane protein [Salmonella enterica]EBM4187523.1 TIGR03745 family integrating conjugative element membrane protein [Salmonella enterica]EBT7096825.1 TIGR03745 family integrating conjugative element membrane protein [Salmonella enterica]ELF2142769.1 TIGR03745 family integrating conjugative element membrane protein [Salmonella enterica]ELX2387007.1 TIGR03745 family integrating conjugative element membrane protein [Salmonella enterica]
MNAVARFFRHFSARVAVATSLAYAASQPAQAALPSVEPPSSGGGGGLMDTLKGYIQDGIVILGLVAAAVAFLVVANSSISTFHEVREGKSNWGKFGAIIVVGIVLLVAVIWLVGKSAEILF